MAEEKIFKVDTGEEPDEVKIEEDDDGVVLDTSTGKGLENIEIPDSMRAPVFEGGRTVRIMMNEKYGFPHGIQITAGIANHKPQLVGKPSDVQRIEIPEDDIIIEIGGDIVYRASDEGFPDTQRGPEWVTEILNKAIGTEEPEEEVIEPEDQQVINQENTMAEEKDLEEEIEEEEDEVEPWPEEEVDDEDDEDEDDEDDEEDGDEEGGVADGDGIEEDTEEHLSREEFDEQVLAPEGIRPMSQRGIDMWEEYNNQF